MKLAKRILVPLVGLVLLICLVFAVACEETPAAEKYTVTVTCDATKGSATLTPAAEDNKYEKGTSVTLTVSAKENYEISEVKVNGTAVTLTDNKYTFTVASDTAIVVSFDEKQPVVEEYTVTVTCDATKGSATLTPVAENNKYAKNTSVTLAVSAKEDYEVSEVKVNGSAVTLTEGKYIFTVQGNTEIVVSFDEKQPVVEEYTVTVTCDATKGSATLTPVAENNKYAKNTSVTLEVSAKENYEVSEVKVNGSAVTLTEGKYTFTVQGNTEIVVSFNEKQPVVEEYTVTVTCDATKGSATLTPVAENNKYAKNTSVTLAVSAKENYEVSEVKVNGGAVTLTEGKYTFTVQGNTEIVVTFEDASQGGDDPEPVKVPQSLWGNYEGKAGSTKYEIEIKESSIVIVVNGGEPIECAFTKFVETYVGDVYFNYNNIEYHIEYYPSSSDLQSFELYSGDSFADYICDCQRVVEGGGDEPELGEKAPERFWGNYEGESQIGEKYEIEIDEYYITIIVDEGTPVKCVFTFVDNDRYDGKLYFTYDGAECYAEYDEYGDPVEFIIFMKGNTYIGKFYRDSEGGGGDTDPEIVKAPENLWGNYEGTDSDHNYAIEITETSIIITVDDGDPVVCAFTSTKTMGYVYFYFNYNNKEYHIEYWQSSDLIEDIELYDGDSWSSLVCKCYRVTEEPAVKLEKSVWGKYEGTYENKKYVIEIEESYVIITVDGGTPVKCVFTSVLGTTSVSVYFDYNNYEYSIEYKSSDSVVESIEFGEGFDTFICKRVYVTIDDTHIGTYEGTAADNTKYVIKLEENRVIVTVFQDGDDEGVSEICYYLEESSWDDIYFMWNGLKYNVYFNSEDDIRLYVYNPYAQRLANLTPVDEGDSDVTD